MHYARGGRAALYFRGLNATMQYSSFAYDNDDDDDDDESSYRPSASSRMSLFYQFH